MRLHIGPEQWAALADTTPTTRTGWVSRLGGGHAASVAVSGAIRRKRLVPDGAMYRLDTPVIQPGQLTLELRAGGPHVLG